MKTGNKNQATILAIVAVGAIAFLVIQLLPSRSTSGPGPSPASAVNASNSAAIADLPLALVGDPFSHPRLATKPAVPAGKSSQEPHRELDTGHRPITWYGTGGNDQMPNPETQNTAENAGTDRQKPQGPQITVQAVMQAGTPVAILQVGGEEVNTFMVGDKLADGVYLDSIGSGFVEIDVHGKIYRLKTGESYGAHKGDNK